MPKNVFGEVFITFAILFLFAIGPLNSIYKATDDIIYQEVRSATNDFQKEVRKDGYLDLETYNNFLNKLNATGKMYDIKIIHTSNLAYPNNSVSEGFSIERIKYGNKSIIPTIYNNQKYTMKYGDDFKIEVTEKVPGNSIMLMGLISGQGNITKQTWVGGGMVQNDVF